MEPQIKKVNKYIAPEHNENIVEVVKILSPIVDEQDGVIVEIEDKQEETIILGEGKTLRLLALELFGDKAFWVYIYKENLDIIPNPNIVRSGIKLKVPDIDKYFIKKDSPESIYKAKLECDRVTSNI